ncbi:MAG: ABC transporter permease [Candidatus Korobacteraceae bacterium]|jgi:putative ABC transport system permease protein
MMVGIGSKTWAVAIDALRTNKVKVALTMLGVIIGSACIVLVITIGLINRNYVLAQIEGVGSNLIYAYSMGAQTLADEINLSDLNAVRELPHVIEAAGTDDITNFSVVVSGKVRPISLIGVTEGFQKIRNLLILKGRFFDNVDLQTASKACLLSEDLARQYRGDIIGKTIRIGDFQLIVIGVFRERVATFGQSEITSESVLIPFLLVKIYRRTAFALPFAAPGESYVKTLYAQADFPRNVPLVTEEVRALLVSRHRAGTDYTVQNLSSILEAANKISTALTIVLLAIGFLALIISGVGIMNIMLVTVTERTSEIGLRRAVGARRGEILYQFLIEAFLISGIGALIGILLAISIKIVLEPLVAEYNLHIPISVASIIISFTASCAIGVLFGYLPASNASRLQPTKALHFE